MNKLCKEIFIGKMGQETLKAPVKSYLDFLKSRPGGEEIQYRTPLENLFNAIKLPHRNFSILQEDRHSGFDVAGTPDFFVYEDDRTLLKRLIGFIECKKPSYQLEKLIDSEQIKKYSKTCENIILTNYRRFILLQNNRLTHDIVLADDAKTLMDFGLMLFDFYQYEYPYINNKKTLAKTLAAQSFYYSAALREFIGKAENSEDSFFIKFNALFSEYQKSINYHYELPDFCDIYSQSLVYGLLLARIDTGKNLDEHDLEYLRHIPNDYKLLIEFLSQGYESRNLPPSIKLALINIGKNINLINIEAINQEFAADLHGKTGAGGKQTIAVYLYEDFLSEYDKLRGTENRKEGGVYYTPYEAADFIARSVNYILKNNFNLAAGFSAENVKTLDFACGTGTFLHSIMELMLPADIDGLARAQVKEKILHDIYGFEILFTPYIIAHTLLTKFLSDNAVHFEKNERLGVYLTNTLDISQHSISALLPRLKLEHDKAMVIKGEEEILAIVGNPPYFGGKSRAESGVVDALLSDYKKDLEGETNLQPLDDIYIKFIRFSQWKIQKTGKGVMGIIVNNSFLDGLIHRQMRKSLYETFDEIYILNLHGNSQKKEGCKSIFDIRIGVAILLFMKLSSDFQRKSEADSGAPAIEKKVHYYSTLEKNIISRKAKLDFLENAVFNQIQWQALNPPETKDYWFIKKDFSGSEIYNQFINITEIFGEYVSGIKTSHDKFCLKYSHAELDKFQKELSSSETRIIRDKYKIRDGRDWKLENAVKDITKNYNPITVYYRPFDYRWTSLNSKPKGFLDLPRYEIMRHFDKKENVGIVFVRHFNSPRPYTNILITRFPVENRATYSFACSAYIAPLYIYGENLDGEHPGEITKAPNFTKAFKETYLAAIDWTPSPEEILSYIYAVLSSPVYREKYIVFLKTGFPAVPMTKNKAVFDTFAVLGKKLVDLHLLKNLPADTSIKVSLGNVQGDFYIEKLDFAGSKICLTVTPANTIPQDAPGKPAGGLITVEGVTPAIFDFEIGSRKPIDLWLKNRIKDRVSLGLSDLRHLKNMVIAIKETIAVMEKIEELGEAYL